MILLSGNNTFLTRQSPRPNQMRYPCTTCILGCWCFITPLSDYLLYAGSPATRSCTSAASWVSIYLASISADEYSPRSRSWHNLFWERDTDRGCWITDCRDHRMKRCYRAAGEDQDVSDGREGLKAVSQASMNEEGSFGTSITRKI